MWHEGISTALKFPRVAPIREILGKRKREMALALGLSQLLLETANGG